jgi:hypothetical protein
VEFVITEYTGRVSTPLATSGFALIASSTACFLSRSGGIGPTIP